MHCQQLTWDSQLGGALHGGLCQLQTASQDAKSSQIILLRWNLHAKTMVQAKAFSGVELQGALHGDLGQLQADVALVKSVLCSSNPLMYLERTSRCKVVA